MPASIIICYLILFVVSVAKFQRQIVNFNCRLIKIAFIAKLEMVRGDSTDKNDHFRFNNISKNRTFFFKYTGSNG